MTCTKQPYGNNSHTRTWSCVYRFLLHVIRSPPYNALFQVIAHPIPRPPPSPSAAPPSSSSHHHGHRSWTWIGTQSRELSRLQCTISRRALSSPRGHRKQLRPQVSYHKQCCREYHRQRRCDYHPVAGAVRGKDQGVPLVKKPNLVIASGRLPTRMTSSRARQSAAFSSRGLTM